MNEHVLHFVCIDTLSHSQVSWISDFTNSLNMTHGCQTAAGHSFLVYLSTPSVAEAALHPLHTINCEGYGRKQPCSMIIHLN